MNEEKPIVSDILGLRPWGELAKLTTEAAVQEAKNVFERLAMPAVDELGLVLRDRVRGWRILNAVRVASKLKRRLDSSCSTTGQIKINTALLIRAFDLGSLCEDETLQEMWAGLLESAASDDGADRGSVYVEMLGRFSSAQARILQWSAERATLRSDSDPFVPRTACISKASEHLRKLLPSHSADQIEVEVHGLRSAGILHAAGMFEQGLDGCVAVSRMGASLYLRTHGKTSSVESYLKRENGKEAEDCSPKAPNVWL